MHRSYATSFSRFDASERSSLQHAGFFRSLGEFLDRPRQGCNIYQRVGETLKNLMIPLPARVIHNWRHKLDFSTKKFFIHEFGIEKMTGKVVWLYWKADENILFRMSYWVVTVLLYPKFARQRKSKRRSSKRSKPRHTRTAWLCYAVTPVQRTITAMLISLNSFLNRLHSE